MNLPLTCALPRCSPLLSSPFLSPDSTPSGDDPEFRGQAKADNGEAIDSAVQATKFQESDSYLLKSTVDAGKVVVGVKLGPIRCMLLLGRVGSIGTRVAKVHAWWGILVETASLFLRCVV